MYYVLNECNEHTLNSNKEQRENNEFESSNLNGEHRTDVIRYMWWKRKSVKTLRE